ncbi:MAG: hypothetical protein BWY11_01079 [Firmicutes bacterium ADurb.Bin182]|nr:MAG: hypothetical protein BWY11_01079 [Firmicutes bacterium ADurb.Bin182]
MKRFFILFLIMISVFSASCGSPPVQYPLPLSREDVESVIAGQQLEWRFEEAQSFDEFHTIYSFRDDDGVLFAVESRGGDKGERSVSVVIHTSGYSEDQMRKFHERESYMLFDLAGSLFGNPKETKRFFGDVEKFMESKESCGQYGLSVTKRIGDNHFLYGFSPWSAKSSQSKSGRLTVMNTAAFERQNFIRARGTENTAKLENRPLEIMTVAGIKAAEPAVESSDEADIRFAVRGRLEDIRKLKDIPESFKNKDGETPLPCMEDYLIAKLTDATGSMEVYLRPTSLSKEELGVERDHYMQFFSAEESFFVIVFSALTGL